LGLKDKAEKDEDDGDEHWWLVETLRMKASDGDLLRESKWLSSVCAFIVELAAKLVLKIPLIKLVSTTFSK
jgi:hypothetical protein